MKLKIWKENALENDTENQLYLKLVETNKYDMTLSVCDKTGTLLEKGAHLLYIDNDYNVIVTLEGLNDLIPLKTDIKDQLLVYEEHDVMELEKGRFMNAMSKDMLGQIKEKIANQEKNEVKH